MPSEGYKQKPAGVCVAHKMKNNPNATKTMIAGKIMKIKPQEYTAYPNAVMQANK
jgi:hypothetical protein